MDSKEKPRESGSRKRKGKCPKKKNVEEYYTFNDGPFVEISYDFNSDTNINSYKKKVLHDRERAHKGAIIAAAATAAANAADYVKQANIKDPWGHIQSDICDEPGPSKRPTFWEMQNEVAPKRIRNCSSSSSDEADTVGVPFAPQNNNFVPFAEENKDKDSLGESTSIDPAAILQKEIEALPAATAAEGLAGSQTDAGSVTVYQPFDVDDFVIEELYGAEESSE